MRLKECPCGDVPAKLSIYDAAQGGKWAYATPDCCGEWSIEFRTGNNNYDTDECMELAAEAWNEAPRKHAKVRNEIKS